MRTLKFRFWRGDKIQGILELKQGGILDMPWKWDKVDQFTGLSDKQGKEIFEGDIVKGPTSSTTLGKGFKSTRIKEIIFQVKWSEWNYGGWMIEGNYDNNYRGMPGLDECEVIGNIYENPELLK